MKISERALGMTASPIRKLVPYADAAKKKGKKVYHLNIGQPDIATSPKFMEAIRKIDQKVVAYGNSQGDMNLIKAIQKYYDSWDIQYEPKISSLPMAAVKRWKWRFSVCAIPVMRFWCLNRIMQIIRPLPNWPALR